MNPPDADEAIFEQLEFARFAIPIREAAERHATKRQRRRIQHLDPDAIQLATSRVLIRANVTFATYVLMKAAAAAGQPATIARLAVETGMSPHATRHQLNRSHWFEKTADDPAIYYQLAEGAARKLQSIQTNLTRELATH